ncbi:hypothetical protein ACFY93_18260 [Streptomyces sp. NPDC008313]|uniref:hypothetical protein n=1 Tax=Streptomyces sp. NPDC008313 TaxID=3364826 RepID=UPI0036F18EB4
MELRGIDELMDLLHACRGVRGTPDGLPRSGPAAGRTGTAGAREGAADDPHEHALRTAALLRRDRPGDKELQVAGLVHGIGPLLAPAAGHARRPGPAARTAPPAARTAADTTACTAADAAADAIRPLLGERVARLVRLHAAPRGGLDGLGPLADDALTLRQAHEAAGLAGLNAGVMEDWRTLLELVAARHARLGAVD